MSTFLNSQGGSSRMTTYHAGVLQASAHRLLQKHCDNLLQSHGITKTQWLIVGTVLDAGKKGIRITELSNILSTTLAYLTNTINLLESKNILTRASHTKDERSKIVKVHPAFLPKCEGIEKGLRNQLRHSIYANIAPEEFRIYIEVLYKISKLN